MKLVPLLLFAYFASITYSFAQNLRPANKPNISKEYNDLYAEVKSLRSSMISYMKSSNPSYNIKDVKACTTTLLTFLEKMDKSKSQKEGMRIVKMTILKLNKLNNKCGGQLIETMEREQIAQIIIFAGYKKGYNSQNEDITEQWREW